MPNFTDNLLKAVNEKKFYFLIACFSVLLNWAGHSFVYENSYRFLTFDMLGTFVAAITLGSVWAVIVAITTPIVLSNITSSHFIYFAVINITGALFWGWLAESGKLTIFNTKTNVDNDIKKTFFISARFILFAGIATGLVISVFSSIIKNVVFQDAIFKQPYSIYFTESFRNLFNIENTGGILSLIGNYAAETFVEIPNMILTVLIGSIICVTILKYNTVMLTEHYRYNLTKKNISWFNIFLTSITNTEFILFILSGYVYISTVKTVSHTVLPEILEKISIHSFQNFLFLEMISIPLIVIILILFLKMILPLHQIKINYDLLYLRRSVLNKKDFERDTTKFILVSFIFSVFIVAVYLSIIIHLTGITPFKYYEMISGSSVDTSNFLWLIILLVTFILIDKYNNNLTYNAAMESELIKKQTVSEIKDSFESQIQRLQSLELNWAEDTVELLRSSRHDLVNQLEKTNTGFNDILSEVYEKIVKPYRDEILENQKTTREHVEDLSNGKLHKTDLNYINEIIVKQIEFYNYKLKPHIEISINALKLNDKDRLYCYINRLIFIAVRNIIDNSVFALQKLLMNDSFSAKIKVSVYLSENKKNLMISIIDNAGGLDDLTLSKIYKQPLQSSKGDRLGEGTLHSAYFAGILNGTVSAKNSGINGEKGLETIIVLPVYEEDK